MKEQSGYNQTDKVTCRNGQWISSNRRRLALLALLFVLSCNQQQSTPPQAPQSIPSETPAATYQVFRADFDIPEVRVQDHDGEIFAFTDLLQADKAYFVQFMFTSCPTICPVMSGHFAALQEKLVPQQDDIQLISISIDPKHDTPQRLAAYAEQFGAASYWTFLSGKKEDIRRLQYAFENYTENKMSHRPVTFFRPADTTSWLVLEGFASGEGLWTAYQNATDQF